MILTFKNNEFEMDNIRSRGIHNPAFSILWMQKKQYVLCIFVDTIVDINRKNGLTKPFFNTPPGPKR